MTAPTGEFDQLCLTEYITAERLVEEATRGTTHGDPFLSPSQTNPTATPWDGVESRDLDRALKAREDDEGET